MIDLHALPGGFLKFIFTGDMQHTHTNIFTGAQNPWNHAMSFRGTVNWLYGTMGLANAQQTLEVLRSLTQFITQPEYTNVVTLLSVVNEVQSETLSVETVLSL